MKTFLEQKDKTNVVASDSESEIEDTPTQDRYGLHLPCCVYCTKIFYRVRNTRIPTPVPFDQDGHDSESDDELKQLQLLFEAKRALV